MTELDEIDRRLLTLLAANARAPVARLAAKLGLARTTAQARLERLERTGIIEGYTVRLSDAARRSVIRATVLISLTPVGPDGGARGFAQAAGGGAGAHHVGPVRPRLPSRLRLDAGPRRDAGHDRRDRRRADDGEPDPPLDPDRPQHLTPAPPPRRRVRARTPGVVGCVRHSGRRALPPSPEQRRRRRARACLPPGQARPHPSRGEHRRRSASP